MSYTVLKFGKYHTDVVQQWPKCTLKPYKSKEREQGIAVVPFWATLIATWSTDRAVPPVSGCSMIKIEFSSLPFPSARNLQSPKWDMLIQRARQQPRGVKDVQCQTRAICKDLLQYITSTIVLLYFPLLPRDHLIRERHHRSPSKWLSARTYCSTTLVQQYYYISPCYRVITSFARGTIDHLQNGVKEIKVRFKWTPLIVESTRR